MILAGDVGGTKVHLSLYQFENGRLQHVTDERFPAKDYAGLEAIVQLFFEKNNHPEVTSACFGVPGPVRNGRLKLTNLPWLLDARELSRNLNIDHVFLINDLEANGYGIPELANDQVFTLSPGDPSIVGNRGLVSAGTGLGEALLMWNGKTHVPVASEGGHSDFAPRNDVEIDLLRYLQRTLQGRVSYERVVSGLGLQNVYSFLRDDQGMTESPELRDRMAHEDPNAVIGQLGESGQDELCKRSLDIFVSAYGAEAGNLALKVLATGGMFLGGGIAPKILDKMRDGAFMHAFTDKGRLSDLLIHTPVYVILESRAALMGAAAYAEARAAEVSGQSVRMASNRLG
ncbi:glucokinase [Acidipila sp. EB88]|uniref:glucokinase n=1 Tax=Acidipila sp. EB88 TaxID=2305226 RepID=UPI000F5F911A|nr:glucokinase [Acidipila sp. EB88]RRA47701.1 glucokinase [Acidipila sp. EB88]